MKVVVSDPKTGKVHNIELDEKNTKSLIGLKIGGILDASSIGLPGCKIQITGGSDKDGFPMRSDVFGQVRPKLFLSKPPGYRPKEKGIKKRKRVRGNVITTEIVQVNAKIVEKEEKQ